MCKMLWMEKWPQRTKAMVGLEEFDEILIEEKLVLECINLRNANEMRFVR